jgi:hypothetical protein
VHCDVFDPCAGVDCGGHGNVVVEFVSVNLGIRVTTAKWFHGIRARVLTVGGMGTVLGRLVNVRLDIQELRVRSTIGLVAQHMFWVAIPRAIRQRTKMD